MNNMFDMYCKNCVNCSQEKNKDGTTKYHCNKYCYDYTVSPEGYCHLFANKEN